MTHDFLHVLPHGQCSAYLCLASLNLITFAWCPTASDGSLQMLSPVSFTYSGYYMHHYFKIIQNVHKGKQKTFFGTNGNIHRVMPINFSAYKTGSRPSQLCTVKWRTSYRTASVNAVCNKQTDNVFKCTLY
jgi:hypothetical protein